MVPKSIPITVPSSDSFFSSSSALVEAMRRRGRRERRERRILAFWSSGEALKQAHMVKIESRFLAQFKCKES